MRRACESRKGDLIRLENRFGFGAHSCLSRRMGYAPPVLKPRRQDPLDLTGDWLGLYSYPGEAPPVPFRARLDEVGGDLSGHTLETVATSDKTERTLDANLAGRREGRAVTFLKTYRGSAPGYDAVAYTGDVSADGAEVDGRWTIAGRLSGPFLLIRAGDAAVYGAAVASARA